MEQNMQGPGGEEVFIYFGDGKEASLVKSVDKKRQMWLSLAILDSKHSGLYSKTKDIQARKWHDLYC